MKPQANKQVRASRKQSYEAPRATCVPVQMKKGLAGCLYSTASLCEFTD